MADENINVPADLYQRMVEAPLTLARAEAVELLRRGDVSGASARLEAGLAERAALMARPAPAPTPPAPAPAPTPPAPAPVAPPLAAPGTPPAFDFPMPPGLAALRPPGAGPTASTREDLAAAHYDPSRAFGLRRIR